MLIAFALAVCGYVLAFRSPEPSFAESASFSVEMESSEDESAAEPGPLELTYRPGAARNLELRYEQIDRSGEHAISTRIDTEVYEERKERGEKEGVRFERTYERVGVEIREADALVGDTIGNQIESMLRSAEEVVEVDEIGKPVELDWKTIGNPQVRQTLRILRHAAILLHPRPRRGRLNIGDEWSYRFPADVLESKYISEMEGGVRVREELVDAVSRNGRTLAVIDRTLELRGRGTVQPPEFAEARSFKLSGDGSGRAYFDVERGVLVESRLEFERVLRIRGVEGGAGKRIGGADLWLREKPTPADE